MPVRSVTPILNVSDVAASIEWFEAIGFTWPRGAEPDFGSVISDHAEIFLCLGGQGSQGEPPQFPGDEATGGVWLSWWVGSPAEVDELHSFALEHGLDVSRQPIDEPWGIREFHLRHPDGHTFRVSAHLGD